MDEKTEELRDIFLSVSDEESVTERQEDPRGSLGDGRDEEEVAAVVASMRERYEFDTDLSTEALARVVVEFYDGGDDQAVARALDVDVATARRARMDLHLYEETDLDPPFDGEAARELLDDGEDPDDVAAALDADPDAVGRYAVAARARDRSLRANSRYRDQFEEILRESDLSRRMAEEVREDGLEEATEGMETDVSF